MEEGNQQNNTDMENLYPIKEAEQYVNLLQENITRMASNSANCKNWLIGIIGGAIAVAFVKDNQAYLPSILLMLQWATGLFFFLDCFYLGLERKMVRAERAFIDACRKNDENKIKELLFSFTRKGKPYDEKEKECSGRLTNMWSQFKSTLCAMLSFSTTPFYVAIFIMLYIMGNTDSQCCCCCCCH